MERGTVSNRRLMRRETRIAEEQGYESDPPMCGNCDHYVPFRKQRHPAEKTIPARCGLGGFRVSGHGVCDAWKHGSEVIA